MISPAHSQNQEALRFLRKVAQGLNETEFVAEIDEGDFSTDAHIYLSAIREALEERDEESENVDKLHALAFRDIGGGALIAYKDAKTEKAVETFLVERRENIALRNKCDELEAQLSRAREVMAPFAEFVDCLDEELPDDEEYNVERGLDGYHRLTCGDFRAASTFLKESGLGSDAVSDASSAAARQHAPERGCSSCAYADNSSCCFPDPQDGSEPPMMITAACPNPADGGDRCTQYRRANDVRQHAPDGEG